MKGSAFDALSTFRGKLRANDCLRYFCISDTAAVMVSGHVCIGFYINFADFERSSGFLKFISDLDSSVESYHQVYCVYSKSSTLFFYFLTLPYPFLEKDKFINNILPSFAEHRAKEQWERIRSELRQIQCDVLSFFQKSQVLSAEGIQSFLNLLLNKDTAHIKDIRNSVHDNFNVSYDSFKYNDMNHAILKLKNFPKKDILSDLLFGQMFEFPFIVNCTITKPTKKKSSEILFSEKDYTSQLDAIFANPGSRMLLGDNTFLTESSGEYVYEYDLKVMFFNKDLEEVTKNLETFKERMLDFELIFSREEIGLVNSLTSFFPGQTFVFGEGIKILDIDLKYLLPWRKSEYTFLKKEKDFYPVFIENISSESEVVFSPPTVTDRGGGELAEGIGDEENESSGLNVESTINSAKGSLKDPKEEAITFKENEVKKEQDKITTEQPISPDTIEEAFFKNL